MQRVSSFADPNIVKSSCRLALVVTSFSTRANLHFPAVCGGRHRPGRHSKMVCGGSHAGARELEPTSGYAVFWGLEDEAPQCLPPSLEVWMNLRRENGTV